MTKLTGHEMKSFFMIENTRCKKNMEIKIQTLLFSIFPTNNIHRFE